MSEKEKNEIKDEITNDITVLIKDAQKITKKWNIYKLSTFVGGVLWFTFIMGGWYRDGKNSYDDWAKWRKETSQTVKEVKDWEVENQSTMNFAKSLKNKQQQ